ncbi:hypothetical protein WMY93_013737 [Mugilogobius chulae]|uniref:Cytochrome P450 1A n=1 Tax=Mugilogobius chulae TaxID=88201 RepID=A0AAW0P758_9GOBI
MPLMILPIIGAVSVSEGLVAIATVCLVFLILQYFQNEIPEGLQRLPGPKPLPIIGNVLELGSRPYLSLTEMSKRFGDVFQIQIGMRPVVVLSGSETVRQALIKQGDDFAGRPDLYSFRFISDGKSLAFSTDQTGVWRARRKLAYSALRSFSTLEATTPEYSCMLEEHICKEGQHLIKELHSVMKTDGSFDPFATFDEFGQVVGSGNPADFIPILQYIPSTTMKKFVSINNRFTHFIKKIVSYHYATYDKDNIRDITDSLIDHCEDRKLDENSNIQMSDDKIVSIVNDLFGAGFEQSLPVCPEIYDTVGQDRFPRLSDKPNLPYVEAFILEVLRHSSFLPFTIPHCTTKNTSLSGYFIPKDTCVFINQWQINHDPDLWKDPSAFNPTRFLNSEGTEVNKVEGEKVVTFGLGKRRCIGEVIARNEVFLFLAILIQKFDFHKVPDQTLDMTPEYGLTMKHKRCHIQATLRAEE